MRRAPAAASAVAQCRRPTRRCHHARSSGRREINRPARCFGPPPHPGRPGEPPPPRRRRRQPPRCAARLMPSATSRRPPPFSRPEWRRARRGGEEGPQLVFRGTGDENCLTFDAPASEAAKPIFSLSVRLDLIALCLPWRRAWPRARCNRPVANRIKKRYSFLLRVRLVFGRGPELGQKLAGDALVL